MNGSIEAWQATNHILQKLYRGFSLPKVPVSRLKRERNAEIRARYAAGVSVVGVI
jgi:hypothetical protein